MGCLLTCLSVSFFFNDTATTEIYTLSLHDALPISHGPPVGPAPHVHDVHGRGVLPAGGKAGRLRARGGPAGAGCSGDRKSTRLNSSHPSISYAVFCLKKKKKHNQRTRSPHTHT